MISASDDLSSDRLTFANAGYWPPLTHIDGATTFLPLAPGFLPIRLNDDTWYEAHVLEMTPGNIAVFEFSRGRQCDNQTILVIKAMSVVKRK